MKEALHISLVAVARPNFMKVAPAYHALAAREILSVKAKKGKVPPLWDGHAAERIAEVILFPERGQKKA